MKLIKQIIHRYTVHLIILVIAIILWLLFYPAYMSADSIVQYEQAMSGNYEDWHPPIIAIILHYVITLGGGVSTITLMQTITGCLGIYLLGKEILRQNNVPQKKCKWIPLYILLISLLPISPLPFYLMAFVKDTAIAIGLIWIAYLGLCVSNINNKKTKEYTLNYIALVAIMSLMFLTRHNAIALIPVFFILLFYNSRRLSPHKQPKIIIILWSTLPLLVFSVTKKQLYAAYEIKKMYPENQVMAMESVGILINDISKEKYLPYIKNNLTTNYKEAYSPGNVASVMNWEGSEKTLNQSTFSIIDERIKQDYYNVALHAPIELIKVKWNGFINMLKPNQGRYWYHTQLDKNRYGLIQNQTFQKARLGWQRLANNIRNVTITSFIGAEHIVWFLINLILIILFIMRKKTNSILFIILLLPLGYYFSYLLACTGDDFRFMYPSTLLTQVIAISLLFTKKKGETQLSIKRNSTNV